MKVYLYNFSDIWILYYKEPQFVKDNSINGVKRFPRWMLHDREHTDLVEYYTSKIPRGKYMEEEIEI